MKNLKYPNITAERARRGWSLEDFGKVLGVSRKTINNWETKGSIPQAMLEKMADVFGCSIEYLLAA